MSQSTKPDHPLDQKDASTEKTALTHEEAIGLLDAWREGELEQAESERVEAHFVACARCQSVDASLGGGLKQAMTTGEASREPDLLPGVQRRIRLRSRGKFYGEKSTSPWMMVLASGVVLTVLVVAYLVLGHMAVK